MAKKIETKLLSVEDFKAARKLYRVDLPDRNGYVYVLPPTPRQAARLADAVEVSNESLSSEMRVLAQLPLMAELIVDDSGKAIFNEDTMSLLMDQSMETFRLLQEKITELTNASIESAKNGLSVRENKRNASALRTTSRSEAVASAGSRTPN